MILTKTNNNYTHELFGSLTTIINENNEVFFIGKEVAEKLGYSDTAYAIKTHCKGVEETSLPTNGGNQIMKIIPERDLYRLIMRSKKPEAELFEEWVTGEVLPSIRKTGSYDISIPKTYIAALEALVVAEKEKLALQESNNKLEVKLDLLLDWVSIIRIADHNKVSENKFNWRILKKKSEELGYEIKKATSPRFEYMNLYHINCFKSAYPQYNYNIE